MLLSSLDCLEELYCVLSALSTETDLTAVNLGSLEFFGLGRFSCQ